MADTTLSQRFDEASIALDAIQLDPNNPRLLGLNGYSGVREDRISEDGVQASTLKRLNEGVFDMDALRASIASSGLLQVDRIVVRPIGESEYVVVEGNRRIAACKTLLQQHGAGEITLDDDVRASVENPRVLVLTEPDTTKARLDQWVIQGVRHISGIRPWGAFQAAKTIEAMIDGLGYSEDDVVAALSIQKARVRRSLKVLAGLTQMEEDDDFGTYSGPDLYGFFDEVIKRPKVRSWLGWSDSTMRFEDVDRIQMFYAWITPDEDLGASQSRIPASSGVRSLDNILDDAVALSVLNTPGRTLQDALASLSTTEPEWREPVRRATKALESIPLNALEHLTSDDEKLIHGVADLAANRLSLAKTLATHTTAGAVVVAEVRDDEPAAEKTVDEKD